MRIRPFMGANSIINTRFISEIHRSHFAWRGGEIWAGLGKSKIRQLTLLSLSAKQAFNSVRGLWDLVPKEWIRFYSNCFMSRVE